MNNYVIFTDSGCDLSEELLKEWGIRYAALTYSFNDSPKQYGNYEIPSKEFYQKMREGGIAKTAAINIATFQEIFEGIFNEGLDVLYIGFSGGLSSTSQAGEVAAKLTVEKYPERKIKVIDTLAASAGQGMLVYMAKQAKENGATLEEAAALVEKNVPKLAHWFTVDDLVYLKRGGRVSAVSAFVGGMLGIKPVLHVDDEGHLIPVTKVRGRRTSLRTMADKYTETAEDPKSGLVYISHGDCIDDALALAKMIEDDHGVKTEIITDVGPVIGAHSGPGTLALFFVAKER